MRIALYVSYGLIVRMSVRLSSHPRKTHDALFLCGCWASCLWITCNCFCLLQVWFQNARAKFRRSSVKGSDHQHSSQLLPSHHHDAVAVAAAGSQCPEMQSSADDVNSSSPVSAVSLLDLHSNTNNDNNISSSNSSVMSTCYERLPSPSSQYSVPALADILCCPSFNLWFSQANRMNNRLYSIWWLWWW